MLNIFFILQTPFHVTHYTLAFYCCLYISYKYSYICYSVSLLQICAHFIHCIISFKLVSFWHRNFCLGLFPQRLHLFQWSDWPLNLCVPTVAILYHALKQILIVILSFSKFTFWGALKVVILLHSFQVSEYIYNIYNLYTIFSRISLLSIYDQLTKPVSPNSVKGILSRKVLSELM